MIVLLLPNYLTVAIACVLDDDRQIEVRKEALCVMRQHLLISPTQATGDDIVSVLEKCSFMDHIGELIDGGQENPTFMISLFSMLHVLTSNYQEYMKLKVRFLLPFPCSSLDQRPCALN